MNIIVASNAIKIPDDLAVALMDKYADRPLWAAMGPMSFDEWLIWWLRDVISSPTVAAEMSERRDERE